MGNNREWILLEVLPRIDGKAKIWVAFTSLLCLWVEAVIDLWLLKDFYSLENVQKKPMKQKKVHSSPLYQIGLSKNHFTVVLGSNKMCLLVKGGCMSPLGKYYWISQPLQNPKIPSGSFVERRKLGLEQTFVNFQSCQRCKKKLAFPVTWSQKPLYLLFPIFSLTEGVRGASILTECRTWQPNPIEMPSTQRSAKTKGENDDLLTFVNWLRYPLWRVEQVKKAWRSEAEPPNILKSHFFQKKKIKVFLKKLYMQMFQRNSV